MTYAFRPQVRKERQSRKLSDGLLARTLKFCWSQYEELGGLAKIVGRSSALDQPTAWIRSGNPNCSPVVAAGLLRAATLAVVTGCALSYQATIKTSATATNTVLYSCRDEQKDLPPRLPHLQPTFSWMRVMFQRRLHAGFVGRANGARQGRRAGH